MKKSTLLVLFLSLFVVSCGDDAEEETDLSGTWEGDWTANEVVGNVIFDFIQEDNILHGEVVLNGSPCFDECLFRGTIDENNHTNFLIFDLDMPLEEMVVIDPLATREELAALGVHVISVTGDFTNNTLNSEFHVVEWGLCTGVDGLLVIERQ